MAYALGAPYGAGTIAEGAADFGIQVFEDICKYVTGGRAQPAASAADATALAPDAQGEVRRQIEEVAQSNGDEAAREMAAAIDEVAPQMSAQDRALLASYATLLPDRVRRTLQRSDDPSGRTVPADRVFRTALDLAEFLPPMPRFAAGEQPVYNRTLVRLLGSGTFGEVWEASKSGFKDRRVALKFCLGDDAALMHEARLAQRLDHPGIVRLEEIHARRGDIPLCLEYEFVDGRDLVAWFHSLSIGDADRNEFVAGVVAELAEIVHAAHEHRNEHGRPEPIVHRDLKPANVLVPAHPRGPRFKVTDFGIGAILRTAEESQQATLVRTLGRLGSSFTADALSAHTPRYSPEEQVAGTRPDPRNDVFALGVIWFQLLRRDFSLWAPRGAGWKRQLRNQAAPEALISLIERCVDSDPAERPENAGALASELRSLLLDHSRELREQIALIEGVMRKTLKLGDGTPLSPVASAGIRELKLRINKVTDVGLAWLARADSGLKALTTLDLNRTRVTDQGVAALARETTGLKALTTLDVSVTRLTDAGLTALARETTGLKALTALFVIGTKVTDAGLAHLARETTGLRALTRLYLGYTQVTDAGLAHLARETTGLKALTILDLRRTPVTVAGLAHLARETTGLKVLTSLVLEGTPVTDAGLAELARTDTGLKRLRSLWLGNTAVTDAGLKELARETTGLKILARRPSSPARTLQ
ncbi:MAG: protein kinase [Planctomycetes bacterium]|nr:protein kinase [Planctomycetota bacterium]